jgi:hypothetical protein
MDLRAGAHQESRLSVSTMVPSCCKGYHFCVQTCYKTRPKTVVLLTYTYAQSEYDMNPLFFSWRNSSGGPALLMIESSRSHSRHTTTSRTPLDDRSASRRGLYLTTYNNHIHVPPPETQAIDCKATGIGPWIVAGTSDFKTRIELYLNTNSKIAERVSSLATSQLLKCMW